MKRTVFYIKPNEKSAFVLQSIVDELAQSCNGPSFAPHLTFYTGTISEDESAQEILKDSIQGVSAFLLTPKKIEFTDTFTRSFYLAFELPEALQELNNQLKAKTKYPSNYELRPHLSLAYTSVPVDVRRTSAKRIQEFNDPILFDRVGALQTPDSVTKFEDIRESKNIATFNLSS